MRDSELISRFLDGEIDAFNILVREWQSRIYNFAFKTLGIREEAREVTQKTFIRVYRNLRKLRQPERFSTWIYQIAMNLCRDEMRRNKRNRQVSLHDTIRTNNGEEIELNKLLESEEERTEDALYQGEVVHIIRKALRMIPEEQRVVIIMREYQGLKFREIAEILEEPINTIKSRMYYGLTSLRKALSDLNIDKEVFQYEL